MNETPQERREAAATRRRWITLAEAVAVAGVLIAGLTLYLSWSDRRADDAERKAERVAADSAKSEERRRIGLVATDSGGDSLTFKGVACALQTADVNFPATLGVGAESLVQEYRIEADWFEKPLRKLLDAAKAKSGRLPVLISSQCSAEGGDRGEVAIYDVPYRLKDGDIPLVSGKSLKLEGLVLRERIAIGDGRARLDAIWRQTAPKPMAAKH